MWKWNFKTCVNKNNKIQPNALFIATRHHPSIQRQPITVQSLESPASTFFLFPASVRKKQRSQWLKSSQSPFHIFSQCWHGKVMGACHAKPERKKCILLQGSMWYRLFLQRSLISWVVFVPSVEKWRRGNEIIQETNFSFCVQFELAGGRGRPQGTFLPRNLVSCSSEVPQFAMFSTVDKYDFPYHTIQFNLLKQ